MTSQRAFGIALIGSAIALFLFVVAIGSHASAAGLPEFSSGLTASGYTTTPMGIISYTGLNPSAQVFMVTNGDAQATVELFEYASEDALQQDWLVAPGAPAMPRTNASDFDGRAAYWNQNSVLVVDFRATNDPELARNVGRVFLSQTGSDVRATIVSSRQAEEATVAAVQPPHTGDADLLVQGQRALPVWAGLLWAGLSVLAVAFAAAGSLALVKAASR